VLSVVSDTNIYISALEFGGTPERFLRFAEAGNFRLVISNAIITEWHGYCVAISSGGRKRKL